MSYDPTLGLLIADSCLLVIYTLLFSYEIFVIFRYLVPLKIKSLYMIIFYVLLGIMIASCMVMLFFRLVFE